MTLHTLVAVFCILLLSFGSLTLSLSHDSTSTLFPASNSGKHRRLLAASRFSDVQKRGLDVPLQDDIEIHYLEGK